MVCAMLRSCSMLSMHVPRHTLELATKNIKKHIQAKPTEDGTFISMQFYET